LESFETAEAFVPAIWPLEVGNVLLVAERRKRLNQASVFRFLELLKELPIMVEQETPERMLQEIVYLARKYGLSTYDASYLDLALRLDLPISTLDALLMKAAKKCKVQNYNPLDSK
jgi:predicted nucleic acid-binding protein